LDHLSPRDRSDDLEPFQSRRNATKKSQIEAIEKKTEVERTDEEKAILAKATSSKEADNLRDRERYAAKKSQIEAIETKTEVERTDEEKAILAKATSSKEADNLRDRERYAAKKASKRKRSSAPKKHWMKKRVSEVIAQYGYRIHDTGCGVRDNGSSAMFPWPVGGKWVTMEG